MTIKLKRKKMWIIVSIILLVIIGLSFTQFEIREDIVIHAPPEKVWNAIVNFENYQQWNSQLKYLGGTVEPQGKLHLKLQVEGAEPYEFKPVISRWEKPKTFAWLATTGLPRIFDGEHFYELHELDEGRHTRVVNREEYRGILSLVMKNLPMMKNAPAGFAQMNEELKAYVEKKEAE